MTTEPQIAGHKIGPRGRAPRRFSTGRICSDPTCYTELSTYNRKDTCFQHSPIRYPRTRGHTAVQGRPIAPE